MMKTAIKHKSRHLRRFLKGTEAVSALEYAIVVGVIGVGIGAVIAALGTDLNEAIAAIGATIDTAAEIAPALAD